MTPQTHRLGLLGVVVAAVVLAAGLAQPGLAGAVVVAPECGTLPPPGAARCLALRVSASSSGAGVRPRALVAARTAPPAGSLGPAILHAAYGLPATTAAANAQTVAIVDAYDDPNAEADLAVFDSQFGLPACTTANGCFTKLNGSGQSAPLPSTDWGWAAEIALDVETVHAVCQNCRIVLIEAASNQFSDLAAAEDTAAGLGGVGEISNSWSGDEAGADDPAFNHPGIAITASTGDYGYLDWKSGNVSPQFPASSPHVIAVGGTTLSTGSGGSWAGETAWTSGGSGCSQSLRAPSWQQAAAGWSATGCGTLRSTADIAADANPATGVPVYGPDLNGVGGWDQVGGTSLSSPIVAAAFGLAGGAQGTSYPGATLYAHQTNNSSGLHDITSGANGCSGTTCPAGSTCGAATSCHTSVGYDGPTGVGAPAGLVAFIPGGSSGGGSGGAGSGGAGSGGGSQTGGSGAPGPPPSQPPPSQPPPSQPPAHPDGSTTPTQVPTRSAAAAAPQLSMLRLLGRRLARATRRGPSVGGGLSVLVGLSAPAVVRFTVFRQVNRHGHNRWVRVSGSFSIMGHGGLNRVRFTGRLSGLPLPAGRYLLVAQVTPGPGQAAVFAITR